MSENILIIGATGSVGFEVAQRLNSLDQTVKIAARNPGRAKSMELKDIKLVHFDYLNTETFVEAFDGIDKLLLVSPPSYLRLQDKVISAIDTAIEKGVKLIVNISAISIESKLDRPMKEIENHINNCGVDSVFLRPNCYMQNFKDLFRDLIIEENQITVPADNAKVCFVDVRDVAEVAVKALTDDKLRNKTYQLTGKKSLNMYVVAHLFSEGLSREIDYISVSDEDFEKTLRSAGWPASTIEGTMQLCSHVKDGETDIVSNDIQKLLGRQPRTLEQFISDYSDNWS